MVRNRPLPAIAPTAFHLRQIHRLRAPLVSALEYARILDQEAIRMLTGPDPTAYVPHLTLRSSLENVRARWSKSSRAEMAEMESTCRVGVIFIAQSQGS